MERRQSQPLGDILEEFFGENAQLREKLMESRVLNCWERVLGSGVAQVTNKLTFRYGKLYVELNSAIVRSELLLSKKRIISLLNAEAKGEIVKDLVLR